MTEQSPQHIILLGITQRCGTNYLYSLLDLHQEIQTMAFPGEDFLLQSSEHLGRYVYETSLNWHSMWGGGMSIPDFQQKMASDIGKGLLSNFLSEKSQNQGTHVLSKTPDTRGVAWAPVLFPDAKVIFLVRNPVSTIASGRTSFGWTYSESMRRWRASARRILAMTQRWPQQTLVVRYEDLMEKKEEAITKILDFVQVDAGGFRFDQIDGIKILGSSKTRDTNGKIDWSGEDATPQSVKLKKKPQMPDWLQSFIYKWCSEEYIALGYENHTKSSGNGIVAWIRYSTFILPDLVKDAYRSGRKAIQSPNFGFQKWCKKQLGLEIETHR